MLPKGGGSDNSARCAARAGSKVWLAAAVFAAVLWCWTIRAAVTLLAGVGAGQSMARFPAAAVAEAC